VPDNGNWRLWNYVPTNLGCSFAAHLYWADNPGGIACGSLRMAALLYEHLLLLREHERALGKLG